MSTFTTYKCECGLTYLEQTNVKCPSCGRPRSVAEDRAGKWKRRFLDLAHLVASWSKDPSTKVGAVATTSSNVVLETGFNGLPRGVEDRPERMERPAKYLWTAHAEENLVAHAARSVLLGTRVHVTHLCCSRCARMLINAGVSSVVVDKSGKTSMPQEEFDVAVQMFREAGVELEIV